MADGDISKRLVSQIRTELNDNGNKIIPVDDIIYRKMSFYQRDWSKRFYCIKIVVEYDLVADQSVYPIESNVVSIVKLSFYDPSGLLLDWDQNSFVTITPVTKHEVRQIILENSSEFTAGMVMYADCYIQATMDDEISRINDPIILEDYYDYLVKAVLSEYRYLREDLMSLETVEARVNDTALAALRINRALLPEANTGLTF